jgi:hypothetical protein
MNDAQKQALIELSKDFSRGDSRLVQQVETALAHPPRTTEEVGYYVSANNNVFENYFRKVASLLSSTPFATQAEDKYVYEIFDQWVAPGRLTALPQALKNAMPTLFATEVPAALENEKAMVQWAHTQLQAHFAEGVMAVEMAFEALGSPLLTIDTGGGDTLLFINVTPDAAKRWRDVEFGVSHEGVPLGVRSAMWGVFLDHFCYALGLRFVDEAQAPNLPHQPPMRGLASAMIQPSA